MFTRKSKFEKTVGRLRKLQTKQRELTAARHKIKGEALRVQQEIDTVSAELENEAKAVSRETGTKLKVSGIQSGEVFGDM